MFNKEFQLSLNKNYVSHWGMAEAVRELIQNALDSESPFVYEFIREADNLSLQLRSEFTTLSPSTLLLGSTSKSGSEKSIGSFGEGYKIALLVLTRLGHPVRIANGEKSWIPKFKYSSKFGEELLVIEEESLPFKHKGLTFTVSGLTNEDVDAIVESCLQMQDHVGAIKQTSKGDILLDKKGKLYVGGLYICETDLVYGYNINPNLMKLERDRQTVSSFDLRWMTKEMWFETEEYERIAEMIQSDISDMEYAEHTSPELVKEACYQLFRKQNPGAVAAKNQAELNALVEKGMTKVVTVGSSFYGNVTSSKSYKSENPKVVESVNERLERWLRNNRSKMRKEAILAFKELLVESKQWKYS